MVAFNPLVLILLFIASQNKSYLPLCITSLIFENSHQSFTSLLWPSILGFSYCFLSDVVSTSLIVCLNQFWTTVYLVD